MDTVKSIACPICNGPVTHLDDGTNACLRCQREYTEKEMMKFPMKSFPKSEFTTSPRNFERSA